MKSVQEARESFFWTKIDSETKLNELIAIEIISYLRGESVNPNEIISIMENLQDTINGLDWFRDKKQIKETIEKHILDNNLNSNYKRVLIFLDKRLKASGCHAGFTLDHAKTFLKKS